MKITWNHAEKLKSEDVQTKILACGLTAFLVLLLIPLFRIGHYNFISVDDFEFASVSVPVWEESHSVWKVLWNQVEYAKTIYDIEMDRISVSGCFPVFLVFFRRMPILSGLIWHWAHWWSVSCFLLRQLCVKYFMQIYPVQSSLL